MFHSNTLGISTFWWIYTTLLSISCVVLGTILIMEFAFSIAPCFLCLWQRVPYYIVVTLLGTYGILAFFMTKIQTLSFKQGLFILIALLFILNALLALYHAGIEWHFWAQTATCSGQEPILDFEHWRQELKHVTVTQCNKAPFRVIGLSPAGWNALLSIALATLASYGAWQMRSSEVVRP